MKKLIIPLVIFSVLILTIPPGVNADENDAQEILILSGIIYENGTAAYVGPWYRRLAEDIPNIKPNLYPSEVGDYFIVLLDSQHNVLSKSGFNVSFWYIDMDTWEIHHTNSTAFVFTIPFVSNTRYVELWDANDTVALSKIVSTNAPTVKVVYPNGGENLTIGKEYTITWTADDLDGDVLEYNVYCIIPEKHRHGAGTGEAWSLIARGLKDTQYTWNISDIYWEPGDYYKIRVIALDGINQGEDVSNNTFILTNITISDEETIPEDADQGEGTPGFELIFAICAIALILFWKRKK